MKKKTLKLVFMMLFMITMSVEAETISYPDSAYSGVSTYMNPIIQSDFPDITLFKDGNDFYACGSSFHFTPYCAIYHSTDLVHWEVISRAVQPTWSGLVSDAPGTGLWKGQSQNSMVSIGFTSQIQRVADSIFLRLTHSMDLGQHPSR